MKVKQNKTGNAEKRKVQATLAVEKRMKTTGKGKIVKSRLAEMTAELDMRISDVQSLYMMVRLCICWRVLSKIKPKTAGTDSRYRASGVTRSIRTGRRPR